MYAPLVFLEQIKNYFRVMGSDAKSVTVNEKSLQLAEDSLTNYRPAFYTCYKSYRNGSREEYLCDMANKFRLHLMRQTAFDVRNFPVDDTFDYLFYSDVYSTWRKNKVAYRVDEVLVRDFVTTSVPNSVREHVLTKFPVDCFYIDYSDAGDVICKGLYGSFIVKTEFKAVTTFSVLHLIGNSNGGFQYIITNLDSMTDNNGNIPLVTEPSDFNLANEVVLEDGEVVKFNELAFYKFFINFSLYLNAANREVVVSERTKSNHTKDVPVIKDKFREVKEFDVGITYGNSVRNIIKRYKKEGKSLPTGRTVTSHYRSAHWHHYWTGTGEDKKLIVKWIEGVFVHGDASNEKVVVHKVLK